MNIIGDIAGHYDELIKLVSIIPKEDDIILVGDLHDRGPKSREVIEWAMTTPNVTTLHSNHGDMFVDFYEDTGNYEDGVFIMNGGVPTINSYGIPLVASYFGSYVVESGEDMPHRELHNLVIKKIPKEHIQWLKTRPLFYEDDNIYVSHAPRSNAKNSTDFVWNREPPERLKEKLQIFGHNSHFGLKYIPNQKDKWAMCIDTSGQEILTCYNSRLDKIYQVPYKKD